jgi:hypothetical protein
VNLEHQLRQIETDERRRHRTISLMKKRPVRYLALTCQMREAVHLITLQVGDYNSEATSN